MDRLSVVFRLIRDRGLVANARREVPLDRIVWAKPGRALPREPVPGLVLSGELRPAQFLRARLHPLGELSVTLAVPSVLHPFG